MIKMKQSKSKAKLKFGVFRFFFPYTFFLERNLSNTIWLWCGWWKLCAICIVLAGWLYDHSKSICNDLYLNQKYHKTVIWHFSSAFLLLLLLSLCCVFHSPRFVLLFIRFRFEWYWIRTLISIESIEFKFFKSNTHTQHDCRWFAVSTQIHTHTYRIV